MHAGEKMWYINLELFWFIKLNSWKNQWVFQILNFVFFIDYCPPHQSCFLFFFSANISETISDEVVYGSDVILAEIRHSDGRPPFQMKMADVPITEKLEKFVEDVK